jgi:alpha-N-acetylglucosaminidase
MQCFRCTATVVLFAAISTAHSVAKSPEAANGPVTRPSAARQVDAVRGLLQRRLAAVSDRFQLAVIAQQDGFDVFEVQSLPGNKFSLRGSSGVAMATGLNWYLKHCCQRHIGWCGSRLEMTPVDLGPVPGGTKRVVLPHRHIVYMNYCTLSYSMAWWDWDRWQWEIDYMAMNGVNMPLGMVGLESVWYHALRRVGLDDEEARKFLVGPAYFAWEWMANIENHCGPLPRSWIDSHARLGKQVLQRERDFGMTPIQQGFSGHVPVAFQQKFPQANIAMKPGWCGFPGTAQLDPLDPLFARFGRIFLEEEQKLFGLGGYYAADPFHESSPPRPGNKYLTEVGKAIHRLFDSVDPHSVWVMQSWSIRAPIAQAVPHKRLLVVDLAGGGWQGTHGFWGHDFVVGQLHNFGNRINLHGDLAYLAANPFSAARKQYPDTAQGMGLFMEGIIQNPVFYDMFFDMTWHDQPVDLQQWLAEYAARRYGAAGGSAGEAWRVLSQTAYKRGTNGVESSSIVTARPALDAKKSGPNAGFIMPYPPAELLRAWDLLLADQSRCGTSAGYRFDVVDVGRQVLSNLAQELHKKVRAAYQAGDRAAFDAASARFLDLLSDIDRLCETRPEYRFGDWLAAARRWGENDTERALYDKNASMLVTCWGPDGRTPQIFDYSWREWSGLIRAYYLPRWTRFHAFLRDKLSHGDRSYREHGLPQCYGREAWNANPFYRDLGVWEMQWIRTPKNDWKKLDVGDGDELRVAAALRKKWAATLAENYAH